MNKFAMSLGLSIIIPFGTFADDQNIDEYISRFKSLNSEKYEFSVELSSLDVYYTIKAWQYDIDTPKAFKMFVGACLTGTYDYAGKIIGKDLVKSKIITQQQYDQVWYTCVGKDGVLDRSMKVWDRTILE
jgi:hypothetical protein